jgi:hypothetical protein
MGRGGAFLQSDRQVIGMVRGQGLGLGLTEHIRKLMIVFWNIREIYFISSGGISRSGLERRQV